MTQRIIVNPVTRISGFLEIDVTVENKTVIDARTKGFLFRGFESMLIGRSPFDSVYFTQRICGICSCAHSVASSLALENALGIIPSEQGRYLRDFVHGCEFLQNHIRHFYQYTLPDYIRLPEKYSLYAAEHKDFRLPEYVNDAMVKHYFESLELSRSAHEMLAVLGGKAPHNHGVFIGGITTQATADKIIKVKSLLDGIARFINDKMVPDVHKLAAYYSDCYETGKGYGNLLSYGCFNGYKELGTLYVDPLIYSKGQILPMSPENITEGIDYAWYKEENTEGLPAGLPEADMTKQKAYSWVKAPRYNGAPFEVGPLARMWLSGEYRKGISTMDRTVARVLEAQKIAGIMNKLLENVIPGIELQSKYDIPEKAEGAGLVDTTRGALGHWLTIEGKLISSYGIITPSGWNLSTRDIKGFLGTVEQALMGTTVKDPDNPVELGRIVRSFDPCVSCATHVYSCGRKRASIQVMP